MAEEEQNVIAGKKVEKEAEQAKVEEKVRYI
jgi:hypothetical protein